MPIAVHVLANEKGSFGLEDSLNLWLHIDAWEDCQIHFETYETTATLLLSSNYALLTVINQGVLGILRHKQTPQAVATSYRSAAQPTGHLLGVGIEPFGRRRSIFHHPIQTEHQNETENDTKRQNCRADHHQHAKLIPVLSERDLGNEHRNSADNHTDHEADDCRNYYDTTHSESHEYNGSLSLVFEYTIMKSIH